MVGFTRNPTSAEGEKAKEEPKNQSSAELKVPLLHSDLFDFNPPELEDLPLSFADTLLDFDSVEYWIDNDSEFSAMDGLGEERSATEVVGDCMPMVKDGVCEESKTEEDTTLELGPGKDETVDVEKGAEMSSGGFPEEVKLVLEGGSLEGESLGEAEKGEIGSLMRPDGFCEETKTEENMSMEFVQEKGELWDSERGAEMSSGGSTGEVKHGDALEDGSLELGSLEKGKSGSGMEPFEKATHESLEVGSLGGVEKGEIGDLMEPVETVCDGSSQRNKVKEDSGDGFFAEVGDLKCSIEEGMGKVSLDGVDGRTTGDDRSQINGADANNCLRTQELDVCESGAKKGEVACGLTSDSLITTTRNEIENTQNRSDEDGSASDSESGSETSSSSLSSSSSSDNSSSEEEDDDGDDDEAGGDGKKIGSERVEMKESVEEAEIDSGMDMEEGEIALSDEDVMVGWINDEDAEDEDSGSVIAGPIRSKNELTVLPPVCQVNVTLLPHHQTMPVGVVSSILGVQVIVDGVEKHNPLNEGSILWITNSRSPLGVVDEIFGPVKNPYYIVRYNSESEVPAGLQQGTSISFVQEFANHVLNDKSVYHKGYDASGENDEELLDEAEFSDDEKEAEYKRMLKMKRRGTNDPKPSMKNKDKKKFSNRSGNWNGNQVVPRKASASQDNGEQPVDQGQNLAPHVVASLEQGTSPSVSEQGLHVRNMPVPPGPSMMQTPGFGPQNGIWPGGFPCQQPQSVGPSNGLPMNSMPWLFQNQPHQLYQMPVPSSVQQISSGLGFPPNFMQAHGQPNFGGVPGFTPWTMGPGGLNQSPFGMGLDGQQAPLPMNIGDQASHPNGPQMGYNFNSQASTVKSGTPQNFNRGGRRAHHRGSVRFAGGRGRWQSG